MSNCIELRRSVVLFTATEIELTKFKELIDQSKDDDKNKFEDTVKYLVRWFLWRNTEFVTDSVIVQFGEGESSHTFRDFRQTINLVLKPLMKKSKTHTFQAKDSDDQSGWFNWPVDFFKGVE